jgi:2-polyprenyl-3-methyl-5-hydroxy-6-metoxy-1,4-benzoquinol methylase
MRLDDLFHGTKRRLGFGAWSRAYFERRFAVPDPWSYETSDYERTKYRRTLEVIPTIGGAEILEVGCAEGVFTAWLAERGGHVLAVDICERALSRAAKRCAALPGVRFACLDIASPPEIGLFDVIVCAEVLYYLHQRGLLLAREALVSALEPGGSIVLVNPVKDTAKVHASFVEHPALRLRSEQSWSDRTRPYTITLLEKVR